MQYFIYIFAILPVSCHLRNPLCPLSFPRSHALLSGGEKGRGRQKDHSDESF